MHVQQNAKILSTCFGCQPHASSGVHKTVTPASDTGKILVDLPSSNEAKLGHIGGKYLYKKYDQYRRL